MLSLAFPLWPNESLDVSCKVKLIWKEGLKTPTTASKSGAAGMQRSSKDGSIPQLKCGCCDPVLHRKSQSDKENNVGNPCSLPLPFKGSVPNPRGKVDFVLNQAM